eukprot:403335473
MRQANNKQNTLVFNELFENEFKFKSTHNSEYQNIVVESCEIFSKVRVDGSQQLQNRTNYIGLYEGVLIVFNKNSESPQQCQTYQVESDNICSVSNFDSPRFKNQLSKFTDYTPHKYLDISLSYLDVQVISRNKSENSNSPVRKRGVNDKRQNDEKSPKIHQSTKDQVQSLTLLRGGIKYVFSDLNEAKNNKWFNYKTDCKKKYALKVIKKKSLFESKSAARQLFEELQIQRKLKNCETALQMRQVFESNKRIYIFLDLQDGGTLSDLIFSHEQFQEKDLRTIMGQLLLGLDFMHSQNIIHRDIKPDNILMTSQTQGIYEIRIADFGLATQLKSDKDLCYHKCGTPSFIAPECLKGQGYSKKFDIFSAGSLMYNMTTGEYLFSDQPEMNILFANKRCNLSHISNKINHLSKEAQDLMLNMLKPKPKLRFDCKQALNHPWFQSDKEALVQGLYINKSIQRMQFMRYPVINTLHINQSNQIKFSLNKESITPQKNGQKMFNFNIMDNNLQNQSNNSNSPINLNYFSNTTKNCQNNNLTVSVREWSKS